MQNVTINNLNIYSYLHHENKALIAVLIFGVAFAIYLFPEYLLYTIISLVTLIAIRYYLLNKKYTKYAITGSDKSYFLFSKLLGSKQNTRNGQYSDNSDSNEYYLEDLLKNIAYGNDWEDAYKVSAYTYILSQINSDHIPNRGNNEFLLEKWIKKINFRYNRLMKYLDNSEKTKKNALELYTYLDDVYYKQREYNLTRPF